MRYGRLDRRITIQRKTVTQSLSGEPVETWANLVDRWASIVPARGDERFAAPQIEASEQVEFVLRWSQLVADLTPLDRIVYPAVEDASPAPPISHANLYDIQAVHELGRREGLRLIAVRRVGVA